MTAALPGIKASLQLIHVDRCIMTSELEEALIHAIVGLIIAIKSSDEQCVSAGFQRLGDLFLITDKDYASAISCYQASLDLITYIGVRRHIADCLLRLGVVLLLEGRVTEARRKLTASRRFYAAAEDPQGYQYCEAILEECSIDGPKACIVFISVA